MSLPERSAAAEVPSHPDAPPAPPVRARKFSPGALLAFIPAAVAAYLSFAPINQPDLFWILAIGRTISRTGVIPTTNLFSYTAPNYPESVKWWLYAWSMDRLQTWAGFAALQVVTAILCGAAFAILFVIARRLGASRSSALALILAGVAASAFRFSPRPYTVSYPGLALTLLVLVSLRQGGPRWRMWLLPPLIALWSNFHAGAVFGLVAIGCWTAEVLFDRLRNAPSSRALPMAQVLATAALSGVGLLLNPAGAGMVRYNLYHLLEVNHVVALAEFEHSRPSSNAAFFVLAALVWGLLLLRACAKKLRPFELLLFAAFTFLGWYAVRLIPEFCLATLPFAAGWADELLMPLRDRVHPRLRQLCAVAIPPVALVGALALTPGSLVFPFVHVGLGMDPLHYPEGLARWVEAHGIEGRCFASWDVSGFVEWRLPRSPVFIDPRTDAYPPELFHALDESDQSTDKFQALLDRYGTEWAFRGTSFFRMSGVGRFSPEHWALVDWDETGQVMLNRSVPRFSALIQQNELTQFVPASDPVEGFFRLQGGARERWYQEVQRVAAASPHFTTAQVALCLERARRGDLPAAAEACDGALSELHRRRRLVDREGRAYHQTAVALAYLGDAARRAGELEAAQASYARALETVEDFPPALIGSGWVALQQGNPNRAAVLFDRVLERDPSNAEARRGARLAAHGGTR